MPPYRILFICHGNIFRSAFARIDDLLRRLIARERLESP